MKTVYNGATQLRLFGSKICNRCKQEKLLEEFPRNPSSRDGYKSICKVCNYASVKARRQANPERHQAQWQASYHKNIEHRREYTRANRGRIREYWRNRYTNDPEYRRQYLDYQSRYVSEHPEKSREYARKWREKNPHKNTEYAMSYKARKLGVTVEDVDYQKILDEFDGICYICEKAVLPHHGIEFDHMIPITRGGIHHESNIRVTHQCCNSRKHTKLLEEMTSYQRRGPDA